MHSLSKNKCQKTGMCIPKVIGIWYESGPFFCLYYQGVLRKKSPFISKILYNNNNSMDHYQTHYNDGPSSTLYVGKFYTPLAIIVTAVFTEMCGWGRSEGKLTCAIPISLVVWATFSQALLILTCFQHTSEAWTLANPNLNISPKSSASLSVKRRFLTARNILQMELWS